MNQIINWLSMGKYSIYVWSCYGLAIVVLLMQCFAIKWQRQRVQQQLKQWLQHLERYKH